VQATRRQKELPSFHYTPRRAVGTGKTEVRYPRKIMEAHMAAIQTKPAKMQRSLQLQQQQFQGTPAALLWPRKSREGGEQVFARQAEEKVIAKHGKTASAAGAA